MTIDYSKIAILSTVINFDLYEKSSQLFPENIQKYVIDGRNGMHSLNSIFYMVRKLKNRNIDWLIMADEDVLFKDATVVFDIISKMKTENYTVCGVRDGGVILHRESNPYVINTFFSIIDFNEITAIWNKNEVIKNSYILDNEFDDDLSELNGKYNVKSLCEPYYCFYLWLRRKKKNFLFLDAKMNKDLITNSVIFNGKEFLYHTWYARSYGFSDRQTERIDKIFEFLKFDNSKISSPIIYKHRTFFWKQKTRKIYHKILERLKFQK